MAPGKRRPGGANASTEELVMQEFFMGYGFFGSPYHEIIDIRKAVIMSSWLHEIIVE